MRLNGFWQVRRSDVTSIALLCLLFQCPQRCVWRELHGITVYKARRDAVAWCQIWTWRRSMCGCTKGPNDRHKCEVGTLGMMSVAAWTELGGQVWILGFSLLFSF